ncbi:hypothetical protein WJX84_005521 [Apatococcus fuscideae]|uniref:Rab-GAP TBC domain-containing protein n=1 Tax=Apatococcus fuscideae TaxID=2026836 RepID=A0AAW1RNH3_9CHLO
MEAQQPSLRRVTAEEQASGSPAFEVRVRRFKSILEAPTVDVGALKRLTHTGIPDRDGLRALAWKILLGYLPPDRKNWDRLLARKRSEYANFCKDLIIDPGRGSELPTTDDHPLSQNTSSVWNAYFKDAEMHEQIERDVMRTHPDMHFFSGSDGAAVTHRKEMIRALFIFAKLNPGLTYIQGMNELLAPLYYTFSTDIDHDAGKHAEADAFYCFIDLISEFRDNFCQSLDNSHLGIKATMGRLTDALRAADQELWLHIDIKNKVNPQFFAFRWITLLLTQEFPFPDAVRLWDTLLSDPAGRTECLLQLCIAMLMNIRNELLEGDFSQNLKMLQRYPPVDVNAILYKAQQLSLS